MKRSGYTLYSCDQCNHVEFISKDTPAMRWIETVITYNPIFVEQGNEKQYVTINNTKQFCKTECLKQFIADQEEAQKIRDENNGFYPQPTFEPELSGGLQTDFEQLEINVLTGLKGI